MPGLDRRYWLLTALLTAGVIIPIRTHAQSATPITSCASLTTGNYIITQPIGGAAPCLQIKNTANVTIDGNNQTITTSGDAVYILNSPNVTVHHFSSNGGVSINGDSSDFAIFHHLTLGQGFYDVSGDDVTVQDSTFTYFRNEPGVADPVQRLTLQRNTIKGSIMKVLYLSNPPLVQNPTTYTCSRGDYLIEDNHIESSYPNGSSTPFDEPLLLTIRCSSHSVVRRNTFIGTGVTCGLYLRDESDYGLYEDNTFDLNQTTCGAFFTGGGLGAVPGVRPDPPDANNNIYQRNTVYVRHGSSLYIQPCDCTNNIFRDNVFRYNTSGTYDSSINILDLAGNLQFIHNTVYREDSGSAVEFDQWTGPANTVRDNIFSYTGTSVYFYDHLAASDLNTSYLADHNLFHNRTGTVGFGFAPSLAAWQGLSPGRDANSLEGDPQFTNPSGGDFSIASSSPAYQSASDGTNRGAIQSGSSSGCTESWTCGAWSACLSGSQSRTCTDANNCGTTANRPPLTQTCSSSSSCTENWSCGNWSACTGGTQSRTCTDANNCPNPISQPPLTQACGGSTTTGPSSGTPTQLAKGSGSSDTIIFNPEIPIPGLLTKAFAIAPTSIGEYIRAIFVYFIWIVGIVAVVMVMYGGIKWVAAAGNPSRINDARDTINSAIIGVIIALTSVVLLNVINPQLTTLKGLDVNYIDQQVLNFTAELSSAAATIAPCPNPKVAGNPSQACSGNHPPENPVAWAFGCSDKLNQWINNSARLYHVDASLIKSIILVETPPSPRGTDFVYSGPELNNGPGYGLGQFKVPMVQDTLVQANNGFPPQCTSNDLKAASGQRLPDNCRQWLDGLTGPLLGHAGMEVQVRMIAVYLHTMLSDTKCIKGDLALAAGAYNQGKGGIGATFCNPNYLSKATPADLAAIKSAAIQYIGRVAQVYPQVCASATQ